VQVSSAIAMRHVNNKNNKAAELAAFIFTLLLKEAIKNNYGESRLWIMERTGKQNSNNINFQL
jgi:hypothetical protein